MASVGDITARLGISTEDFKKDLALSRDQFKQFASELNKEIRNLDKAGGVSGGGTLGKSFGTDFIGSFGNALKGANIGSTLATALGLNLDSIAQKLAAVVAGGTKEEFEQAVAIEQRISTALDERDKKRLSVAAQIKATETQIANLRKEQENIRGTHLETTVSNNPYAPSQFKRVEGANDPLTIEQENKKRAITAEIIEKGNQLLDLKNAKDSDNQKAISAANDAAREGLTDAQKLQSLRGEAANIEQRLTDRKLEQKQIDEARARLSTVQQQASALESKAKEAQIAKSNQLADIDKNYNEQVRAFNLEQLSDTDRLLALYKDLQEAKKNLAEMDKDSAKYAEEVARVNEKQLGLARAARQVRSSIGKEEKGAGDESKLTLSELANLDVFQSGVSSDVGRQGATAREALKIKQQAEDARKLGNVDKAEELRGRFDDLRGGLTSLKSSERGPGGEFAAALAPTNNILTSIDKTLGGKFTNQ